MTGHEAAEAGQRLELVVPEMLDKEESPDQALTEEVVDQKESERWAAVGCLGPLC